MNSKHQLKKQIQYKELQIKRLNSNKNSSEVCEHLLNSLILDKAILKKELDELNNNNIIRNIKTFFTKKEKRICDYFKG